MKTRLLVLSSVVFLLSVNAYAQYPEDALRLAQLGFGVDARSMAMGNAMTGLAQGFAATYFNPAGLAQSRQSEVTMGLNFLGYNDNATYIGSQNSLSRSQTDLSNLGLVYPFPTTRGSFVIAFGYNHGADYNSALSVGGYNRNSSIIPSLFSSDTAADIAYMDFLEAADGTPYVAGNVNQSGTVYKSGGLNNWLASAGLDIAENFSIGITLNLVSGKYHYQQDFQENGVQGDNYDSTFFQSFVYSNQDNQDVSGWNAKIGMMYRMQDQSGNTIARFGATVEFPTLLTITDNFAATGTATFGAGPLGAAGSYTWSTTNGYGQNEAAGPALEYDVTTPFRFGLGVSGGTPQLTAAASIEYVDWTQMQFSNFNTGAGQSPENVLNNEIMRTFKATTSFNLGGEFAFTNPSYSMTVPFLRVGFQYLPSPYASDGSQQAQKFLSGGIGVRIQNSIGLDFAYQYGWWNTTSQLYPSSGQYLGQSTSNEAITNSNFMVTFKYDF